MCSNLLCSCFRPKFFQMSEKIFSRDFQIDANLPPAVLETFMAAQSKLLGLRGHIEKTAKGFKGNLEGDKDKMEKLKELIEKSEQFLSKMTKCVFAEAKEIKKYTTEKFNIK